ncbi:MAG: hypothetical protein WCF26_10250 [Candidatus Sulfotelmatobacter sp.]
MLTTSHALFPAANNGVVIPRVKVEPERLNMVAQMGPPKLLHCDMNSQDAKIDLKAKKKRKNRASEDASACIALVNTRLASG